MSAYKSTTFYFESCRFYKEKQKKCTAYIYDPKIKKKDHFSHFGPYKGGRGWGLNVNFALILVVYCRPKRVNVDVDSATF